MALGNCRGKRSILFYNKLVVKSHVIMNNTSIVFFMVKDIKLARNGPFNDKIHKKVVSGLEQKEIVPGRDLTLFMCIFCIVN